MGTVRRMVASKLGLSPSPQMVLGYVLSGFWRAYERDWMPVLRLSRITIFPIKSCDGLSLDDVRVLGGGALANDRRFALRDAQGRAINAKANAAIHLLRATFTPDAAEVAILSARDGRRDVFRLPSDVHRLADWLSEFFQQRVMVVEDPRGGFPDDVDSPGPTVVSRQTLAEVAGWFGGLPLDEVRDRFRANLEIEGDAPFCEDRLVADARRVVRFAIGEVIFEGVTPCQRCIVPTRHPQTGEVTPQFARQFAERRAATRPAGTITERFDHYYRLSVNTRLSPLSAGGTIRVGDEVSLGEAVPA